MILLRLRGIERVVGPRLDRRELPVDVGWLDAFLAGDVESLAEGGVRYDLFLPVEEREAPVHPTLVADPVKDAGDRILLDEAVSLAEVRSEVLLLARHPKTVGGLVPILVAVEVVGVGQRALNGVVVLVCYPCGFLFFGELGDRFEVANFRCEFRKLGRVVADLWTRLDVG